MANHENPVSCDAASCIAGAAVGLAIGLIGFALMYLSIRRRPGGLAMRPFGGDWVDKGNG
ncbi:hypothetical protein [Cupriavidus necator]|uniref:hypothetical protein n=1 Tax=Cupriavidus necator TaxID=106590 RepID=UPI0030F4625A